MRINKTLFWFLGVPLILGGAIFGVITRPSEEKKVLKQENKLHKEIATGLSQDAQERNLSV